MRKPHQLINQTSGKVKFYTDLMIVDAAKEVMGGIDLDPASDEFGNSRIGAIHYYDEDTDGLERPWFGNVWVNHPFGRVSNPLWINKLIREYKVGNINQFCCITFACTSEKWFQPLLEFRQCFLCPRTNYYQEDGSLLRGVTKGSVVTYGGDFEGRFQRVFSKFGVVK